MVYKKIQKHIEIVRSTITALSSMSQPSCDAIYSLLKQHYSTVGVTVVNNEADLEILAAKQPDLVFVGVKYVPGFLPGTKVWIADYLDRHDISYTGSPKKAIRFEQNKTLAKQCVLGADLKTSPYFVVEVGQTVASRDISLQFPLFVKPVDLGAGQGVDDNSIVRNLAELNVKAKSIADNYDTGALVEEYLPGREFSVAILRNEYSDDFCVMPLELVAPLGKQGARILSCEVKSLDTERSMEVADADTRQKVAELAIEVFQALGARDYGRIDIRMDRSGIPHFLEANLLPSLKNSPGNYFPKACLLNINLGFEAMILHIVRLGLAPFVEDETDVLAVYSPIAAVPVPA